jgi:hypothetical protein
LDREFSGDPFQRVQRQVNILNTLASFVAGVAWKKQITIYSSLAILQELLGLSSLGT